MRNRTQREFNMKILYGGGCALALIITVLLVLGVHASNKTYKYVGSVNGAPISAGLYYAQLVKQRAEVYSYFSSKYGAEDSKDFWTTEYGGEKPVEVAGEKALEECVSIIVQQELAKTEGVINDSEYNTFLADLKEENSRRKQAVKKGKVIYGPVEYTEDSYFSYVFSNMVIAMKAKLQNKLGITDKEIRELYDQKKETAFKLQSARVEVISVAFDKGGREKAKKKSDEILKRLGSGESFEALSKEYNKNRKQIEQVFDDTTKKSDLRKQPKVREAALSLKPGQVSSATEGSDSLSILRCLEYKDLGYKAYEEVKSALKTLLIEDKYNELIAQKVKAAELTVNEKALHDINKKCGA